MVSCSFPSNIPCMNFYIVEYIWTKPWTLVSTLFVLVRYCGLYCLIISTLIGSSFLPGPAKTYVFVLLLMLGFHSNSGVY
ncbi:hypothetical protein L210DRAFT_3536117 [Boletus edulis BED1]|uniref:Uncharacterized protein n=1 Tax=Boletus edulis BED1 TaxID=1328754 RepID=A0AAD4GGE4_BOLED|nr:hypothetical protein L210DRAFT_3574560 [Boletus edulis BED1]KAF8442238.1 hypothetical protein L210DRAFT_3536117 [Boletus edulis BED1]